MSNYTKADLDTLGVREDYEIEGNDFYKLQNLRDYNDSIDFEHLAEVRGHGDVFNGLINILDEQ